MSRPEIDSPLIECHLLPAFAANNLETVRRAFQHATPCVLRQAWLDKKEPDFAPAIVRTGWRGASLLVFAELTDADIFSRATGLNLRTWELGDAFEIFLRPDGQEAYVEFQVTPNNQRLQLRYADASAIARARKTGSLEHALIHGKAFRSATWVLPGSQRWFVYAKIPAKSVCSETTALAGSQWRFSFSRYDYTRGRKEPVISSTSAHARPDFHSQQEWGTMRFQPQKRSMRIAEER